MPAAAEKLRRCSPVRTCAPQKQDKSSGFSIHWHLRDSRIHTTLDAARVWGSYLRLVDQLRWRSRCDHYGSA
ncbi:hypothetical protein PsYK624_092980 [Phanerochaete sordida]|uniref:Uncharacterized protein n=1 Tax=Phanerochaete sordida TaxID=48140 RepID=A0A9P3GGA5_9APHY|nr:hypothetical protein PsYK624_092980 [Phanerochaete sordida]